MVMPARLQLDDNELHHAGMKKRYRKGKAPFSPTITPKLVLGNNPKTARLKRFELKFVVERKQALKLLERNGFDAFL